MSSSTLLNKLGLKAIHEMSDEELRKLISEDRVNRTATRAAGRIKKLSSESKSKPKRIILTPAQMLEKNLDPAVLMAARKSGKTDMKIYQIMKEKGLIG